MTRKRKQMPLHFSPRPARTGFYLGCLSSLLEAVVQLLVVAVLGGILTGCLILVAWSVRRIFHIHWIDRNIMVLFVLGAVLLYAIISGIWRRLHK